MRRSTLFLAVLFVVIASFSMPEGARAGFFSALTNLFAEKQKEVSPEGKTLNTRTVSLLQSSVSIDPEFAKGGGDITVVGGTALLSENGPAGTAVEAEEFKESDTISVYVVREGDSLGTIAQLFNVTPNTIRWANDLKGSTITPGQTLVILPVSGVRHTIGKNDTLASLAKKYKADEKEIARFNNIEDGAKLALGEVLIIPDGEIAPAITPVSTGSRIVKGYSGPKYDGYYQRPIVGGIKTQGIHGYNAVDLATAFGSPIYAAADGTVIISRTVGYNAGYGNYVVIQYPNGTQTLYAHMSQNFVSPGMAVSKGDQIGAVGLTGKTTGAHVHFEVRGATNPF